MIHVLKGLAVMKDHPLADRTPEFSGPCRLVFEGVVRSRRVIQEYKGDPKKGEFKKSRKEEDGPFPGSEETVRSYDVEGVLSSPEAWVDWNIWARDFRLDIEVD